MSFKPRAILGLDFDGVLHPDRCLKEDLFVHLDRFQEAMREVPEVGIVITSNWRQTWSLERLRTLFAADVAARVLGVTPDLHPAGTDVCGIRQHELEDWVSEHAPGLPYLALDDNPGHFEPGYPHLLDLPTNGFGLNPESILELVERLQSMVQSNPKNECKELRMPTLKQYVIIAAVSEDGERIALLTKSRGPEELLGRITFPGGHIESTDPDAVHAAQRELLEETGVQAPLESFKVLEVVRNETRELHLVFVACDISHARKMEDEWVHVESLRAMPLPPEQNERSRYAPDFFERMAPVMVEVEALRAAHAAAGGQPPVYVAPYQLPNFRQSLDKNRPHRLLDENVYGGPTKLPANRRHQLVYQYTDTGDTVVVPNVWYNQTPAMRAGYARFLAQQREDRVEAMRRNTPLGWTEWMVDNVAPRMLANAAKLREHADKLEAGTVTIYDSYDLVDETEPSVGRAKEQEAAERLAGTYPPAGRPVVSGPRRMRM